MEINFGAYYFQELGYLNITYAEWILRWPRWVDIIAAMNDKVKKLVPKITNINVRLLEI